jgi:hypothetical protein
LLIASDANTHLAQIYLVISQQMFAVVVVVVIFAIVIVVVVLAFIVLSVVPSLLAVYYLRGKKMIYLFIVC